MKKIRLTEKNLQTIIGKVVKESQKPKNPRKYRLSEAPGKIEVWCECGNNEGCYGSWKGGASVNCKCCDELLNWDKDKMAPSDVPTGMDNDIELDMATDIMRETYRRLKKSRR